VFASRFSGRLDTGRGRFRPLRLPYFPEPAAAALAGIERLLLVEATPPISFFGYPGQPSHLAPEGCQMQVVAAPEEDGIAALQALADELETGHTPPSDAPRPALPDGPLTADSLGQAVSALLPEHAIVSDEMVSAGDIVGRHLVNAAPHVLLPVTGGSIGQGLPVAVGAAIACPDRKVIALEADGSGMYTLQSLWTMARESLDITVVILANRRYRILDVEMQRTGAHGFGPLAERMVDLTRPDLDWVSLARGMGVPAARAATAPEFAVLLRRALAERGPSLVEAMIPCG
jgi:acetolactate synthase-1/2/3 large subunit